MKTNLVRKFDLFYIYLKGNLIFYGNKKLNIYKALNSY